MTSWTLSEWAVSQVRIGLGLVAFVAIVRVCAEPPFYFAFAAQLLSDSDDSDDSDDDLGAGKCNV